MKRILSPHRKPVDIAERARVRQGFEFPGR